MDFISLVISGLILFFIIFGAVRLAIYPLIGKEDELDIKSGLSFMRDIGILNGKEHKIITDTYQSNRDINSKQIQIDKHSKILYELKELELITEPEYEDKLDKLRHHFKVD